ncbi:MAG: S8 family serine peptidase [Burkholderiales bacterium]
MHRPARLRPLTAVALALALAGLAACGGGSSSGDGGTPGTPGPSGTPATPVPVGTSATGTPPVGTTLSAGAGCTLSYTLTASPLISGAADPLLAQQWHLRNTGQSGGTPGEDLRALDAWASGQGAGVRVAVVDDAIEVVHPDLQPNLVDGASRSYRAGNPFTSWPVPCTNDDEHGTAVAGLVLARDGNGAGGAGVAPRASLVAFDALASSLDVDVADALSRDADLNAIYQNSWGSPDNGALHPAEPVFEQAIESGVDTGRSGRGSVYVFAGGNGGCYGRSGPATCLVDDSNYDGYVNHRGVIAVCAVDDRGQRPGYGEPGANLTVCAPSSGASSAVTTTTLRGAYRNDFTGTSASTPMVSGVVALMLAANPNLSWRDVRLILASTARKVQPTDTDWTQRPGGGLGHHHQYGFGVADAAAAVAAARTWDSVGGSSSMVSCGPFTATPNAALPDRSGATVTPVSSAITVTGCGITRIEFVEIRLTAPHAYAGDLRVRLTSPSGTTSRLAEARACAGGCGSYANWRFGSMRHLDEPASGAWSLQVADDAPLDIGTFQSWSLVIHGR